MATTGTAGTPTGSGATRCASSCSCRRCTSRRWPRRAATYSSCRKLRTSITQPSPTGPHKAALERFVLDHLERMVPGFSQKVVVKLSASALTSHRFTLNHQGAMLGWEMAPDQLGADRPDVVSPVKDLFLVG